MVVKLQPPAHPYWLRLCPKPLPLCDPEYSQPHDLLGCLKNADALALPGYSNSEGLNGIAIVSKAAQGS